MAGFSETGLRRSEGGESSREVKSPNRRADRIECRRMFRIFLLILIPYALVLVGVALAEGAGAARRQTRPCARRANPMRVLVIGATGGTGRELVQQALAQGHQVTAFVRDPAKLADRACESARRERRRPRLRDGGSGDARAGRGAQRARAQALLLSEQDSIGRHAQYSSGDEGVRRAAADLRDGARDRQQRRAAGIAAHILSSCR